MNSNICNILEQRRQLALLKKPVDRYEGLKNPYVDTISQQQLNMRRKVEILKYKNSSTQTTGQLTKSQIYTRLVTGNYSRTIVDASSNCVYAASLTSSSDVPGPIETLQLDPKIPLYNYASNIDNYANLTLNPTNDKLYTVYSVGDVYVPSDAYATTIASLVVNNSQNTTSTFNITIPIGIYIYGEIAGAYSTALAEYVYPTNDAIYQISAIDFEVYYNNTLVSTSIVYHQSFTNLSVECVSQPIGSSRQTTSFSCVKYLGNLQISNLVLATQSGYLYEFRMKTIVGLENQISGNTLTLTTGLFTNVSRDVDSNCTTTILGGTPNPLINGAAIIVSEQ